MNTSATAPPPTDHRVPPGRLWFGFGAGAVAWAIQGFSSFIIATQACKDGNGDWGPLPAYGVRILLGAIAGVLLAVTVIAGLVSFGNWRTVAEQRKITRDEAYGREDFMALAGVFLNTAMGLGIVWAGLPSILIDVCINFR